MLGLNIKISFIQRLVISILLACLSSCATTQDKDIQPSATIIDYGLYRALEIDDLEAVDDLGLSNPMLTRSSDEELHTLERRTDEIPTIPFTRFGFEWCARNYPLGIHKLYLVLEHPKDKIPVTGRYTTKPIYRRSKTNGEKIEMCSTETWEMNGANLLRTGDVWTLGIWDENLPLVTHEFRFVTPADYLQSLSESLPQEVSD